MSAPHIIRPTADGSTAGSGGRADRREGSAPSRRRIVGVDVARGLALVGMFGAHLMVATGAELTLTDPTTWLDIVNGRSSLLFALLAGVSLALMTGGAPSATPEELRRIRLRLVGRGAAIFVIGLFVEMLGSGIAVILTLYGVLYILAAFTVHLRNRTLVIAGAASGVLGPPLLALIGTLSPDLGGPGVSLVLFGTYPITVWAALLCAGLVIGRLDLTRVKTAAVMVVCGALIAIGGYSLGGLLSGSQPDIDASAAASSSLSTIPGDEVDVSGLTCQKNDGVVACFDPGKASLFGGEDVTGEEQSYVERVVAQDPPAQMLQAVISVSAHSGGVLEVLASGGFAVAVLGLCLLVTRYARWIVLPLAAYGAVPLTGYVVQAILILAGAGTWLSNPVLVWVALSLLMMAGALIWTRTAGKGPLERLTAWAADAMALTGGRAATDRPRV
ncbi:heparan-alpha-glucosaminide N-acetyltransferase domain-containing protein [Microbacterium oxydans]|uniref:heparan-alpha-glucosaminide N-acetyltransferase domain-containing protein n=1 Tax=Microbacterium oxydans TaxID=82380 RepID=UPI0024AD549A|nr:heparan-alpha-glucosaminide N-acetyltransferase domain-containing protein [Microbacterium oxydans]